MSAFFCDVFPKGVTYRADGYRDEGIYVDDVLMTGWGTKYISISKNNRVEDCRYEGEFVNGTRTGTGTLYWPNGERYEGEFVDGERAGTGTFYWPNGERYEGEFHDIKINDIKITGWIMTGSGKYFYKNGDIYEQ